MIKNAMEVKLLKIEMADVDEWEGNPGGSVYLEINGKAVEIIIHACGELDFEGFGRLTHEESDAVMDFFDTNKQIAKAFPGDEFD
jgi:hypothetical protein